MLVFWGVVVGVGGCVVGGLVGNVNNLLFIFVVFLCVEIVLKWGGS